MYFSEKKVFVHNQRRRSKWTFGDVLLRTEKVPEAEWALSGLEDLQNACLIIEEYYERNFAYADIKEMDRSNQDTVYHEPANLRQEYRRVLQIPVYVQQEDKATKLTKQGAHINHQVEFCTGMINLYRVDYFPEIGDSIVWGGTEYQIGEVKFRKDHLHQNTAFPLHVTMTTTIKQWGDERNPVSLASTNTIGGIPGERLPPVQPEPKPLGHKIPVIQFDK